ncbi:MAG: S41 family peptidase [Myxococcales bacterium]|nr:S41 family peptidase [Myxococcales bacterium]
MTTLVLLALQLTPPAPNCPWATELLHFAVGHHVNVETYSSLEARRAQQLALAAIQRDEDLFTANELVAAARLMMEGSPANDARSWWDGDCSKFVALANLREKAVARFERIVNGAPRSLAVRGEVEDKVARAYEAQALAFQKDAPPELAQRFARRMLRRAARELRAGQGSWAFVTMVKAVVGSLDPHSDFSLSRQTLLAGFGRSRRIFGVGMSADGLTPWGYRLIAPIVDTSAARPEGLHEGELLTSVGGRSTVGLLRSEIHRLFDLQGDEVWVTVTRVENRQPVGRRNVLLKRRPIIDHPLQAQTVNHHGIAILTLRVRRFSFGVAKDISSALTHRHGADVVVLDLRGNPGGFLHEALSALSLFDAEETFVKLRRAGEVWSSWGTQLSTAWDGPVVMVVDARSGSAAELFTGSLQARGRGLVLSASPTWGKGTVQNVFPDPTEMTSGELVITTVDPAVMLRHACVPHHAGIGHWQPRVDRRRDGHWRTRAREEKHSPLPVSARSRHGLASVQGPHHERSEAGSDGGVARLVRLAGGGVAVHAADAARRAAEQVGVADGGADAEAHEGEAAITGRAGAQGQAREAERAEAAVGKRRQPAVEASRGARA